MKVDFKEFSIETKFIGEKCAPWDGRNHGQNRVKVKSSKTGKWTEFDFWGSIVQPEIEDEDDALHAFECFVSDGAAGNQSFYEFCGEFGYDYDSPNAKKVWEACKKSLGKFKRMSGYSEDEMYELWNELAEVVG